MARKNEAKPWRSAAACPRMKDPEKTKPELWCNTAYLKVTPAVTGGAKGRLKRGMAFRNQPPAVRPGKQGLKPGLLRLSSARLKQHEGSPFTHGLENKRG
jgi:hypothetical protein